MVSPSPKTSARLLSDDDRYYLRTNLEVELGPFEDDPQAQAFYAASSNVTDLKSPLWTRDQSVSWVCSTAAALGLRVKVVFRNQRGQFAYAGRGGGTIFFPADRTRSSYRPLQKGEYLAATAVHELAHIVAVSAHWGRGIQSHGPEFVRSYLELLSAVMPTERTREAFEYLGVQIAAATLSSV